MIIPFKNPHVRRGQDFEKEKLQVFWCIFSDQAHNSCIFSRYDISTGTGERWGGLRAKRPPSSRVVSLDASHLPWWTCGGSTKPHFKMQKSVMSASSTQQAFLFQEPLVLVLSCTRIVRMPVYPVPLPSGFSCTAGLPCTPELLPLITPPQKGRQANIVKGVLCAFVILGTLAAPRAWGRMYVIQKLLSWLSQLHTGDLWIDPFDHSPS